MSLQISINSLGLLLDIIGAILIWKYGLPKSLSREGEEAALIMSDESSRAKAKKYNWFDHIGLALLVFGFVFQLISNFP